MSKAAAATATTATRPSGPVRSMAVPDSVGPMTLPT